MHRRFMITSCRSRHLLESRYLTTVSRLPRQVARLDTVVKYLDSNITARGNSLVYLDLLGRACQLSDASAGILPQVHGDDDVRRGRQQHCPT